MNPRGLVKQGAEWLRKPWIFPILLGLVLVGAYGLHIGSLGFYWDDWENVFLYNLNSPIEFLKYFIYDRPTTIWVYLVFFPIFGNDPVKWQIFNLILRYISLLGLWWVFCQVWPKRRFEIGWLVMLLAVFPGFFQQTIAVTYSRHFMSLALFSLSLIFTVLSTRKPRLYAPFTLLAALLSLVQMMTIEYFVGLEIIRPFMLWVIFRETNEHKGNRLVKVIQWWLPYLIPLLGFFAWRFFLFKPVPGADDPNSIITLSQLKADPVGLVIHLAQNIVQDCLHLMIFIWTNTIDSNQINLASGSFWQGLVIGSIVAVLSGIALLKIDDPVSPDKEFGLDWSILGFIAVMAGGLPVWLTDRQIIVGQWSDRFALGPMLGIGILLVTLITMLGHRRPQKTILLGILLALAISSQYRTVERYRANWEIQRDYYWQFYWRVPAMKPGTAVFGTKMPFGLIADYSVSHAINTIYAPDMTADDIPYWFFSSMRAYGNDIPDFVPDLPVSYTIRNLKFEGSTSNGIVSNYKAGNACVSILKPEDEFSPVLFADEVKLARLSNLDQILQENPDPRVSPAEIFGPEPEHGWCYYYQKAELSHQMEDWTEIVALGNQALEKGLSSAFGMEYEPFIEAYARNGDWQNAYDLTIKANALTGGMEEPLCAVWNKLDPIAQVEGGLASELFERVWSELKCQ